MQYDFDSLGKIFRVNWKRLGPERDESATKNKGTEKV